MEFQIGKSGLVITGFLFQLAELRKEKKLRLAKMSFHATVGAFLK